MDVLDELIMYISAYTLLLHYL